MTHSLNIDSKPASPKVGIGNLKLYIKKNNTTDITTVADSEQSIDTPSIIASSVMTSADQAKTLLRAFWRSSNLTHQIGYHNRATKQFKNQFVKDINEAVITALANSDAGLESYLAMAEYNTPDSRTATNVLGAYGFWVDLDVSVDKAATGKGYKTIEDAKAALINFCKDAGIPEPTHIVSSGGGLHVYWASDIFIDRETWQKFAGKFKTLTKSLGFLADPTRTADIASVLRVPGTYNYKYTPPRLVVLTHSSDKYVESDAMLSAIDNAYGRFCKAEVSEVKPSNTAHLKVGTTKTEMLETPESIENIKSALAIINPDCEREMWFKTCCAIRSLDWVCGVSLARAWSKGDYWNTTNKTASKYNAQEFDIMWKSIRPDAGISIGTLFHFAKEAGWLPTSYSQLDEFEVCETIIEPSGQTTLAEVSVGTQVAVVSNQSFALVKVNPLDQYSLRGRSAELEANALAEVYVLEGIALQGEITVLFAAPNTGKTVITIRQLVDGIRSGRIDPNKVYYLNMDDSSHGVISKNRIAEQYNFHMLTEGFEGFSALAFLPIMRGMIENDQAHGVVIILDTLKKFADVMDNTKTSIFTSVMRAFVMKGGTVIALAHTNKHANKAGKPQYGGVSSILADADCAYTIAEVSANDGVKVVEFENIKKRGSVAQSAVYSYSIGNNISYDDLLASVQFIDESQLNSLKRAEEMKSASETIAIVLTCIAEGINTKMELVDAVAARAEMSKNAAIKFINKYSGTDTAMHKWSFTVGARGAKTYAALKPDESASDSEMPIAV